MRFDVLNEPITLLGNSIVHHNLFNLLQSGYVLLLALIAWLRHDLWLNLLARLETVIVYIDSKVLALSIRIYRQLNSGHLYLLALGHRVDWYLLGFCVQLWFGPYAVGSLLRCSSHVKFKLNRLFLLWGGLRLNSHLLRSQLTSDLIVVALLLVSGDTPNFLLQI